MEILFRILMALHVIICIMLIGVILIQRSKGQGVGLSFGGGAEAIFGAQMGNVLTRVTVVLAILFFVNTAILVPLSKYSSKNQGSIVERGAQKPAASAKAVVPTTTEVSEEDLNTLIEGGDAPIAEPPAAPAPEATPEAPAAEPVAAPAATPVATPVGAE